MPREPILKAMPRQLQRSRVIKNEVPGQAEAVRPWRERQPYCISIPAALMAAALRSILVAMRLRKRTGSSTKMSP